jgi:hypothetical protein
MARVLRHHRHHSAVAGGPLLETGGILDARHHLIMDADVDNPEYERAQRQMRTFPWLGVGVTAVSVPGRGAMAGSAATSWRISRWRRSAARSGASAVGPRWS